METWKRSLKEPRIECSTLGNIREFETKRIVLPKRLLNKLGGRGHRTHVSRWIALQRHDEVPCLEDLLQTHPWLPAQHHSYQQQPTRQPSL
nr:MAG TPA: hypothetical protein [Caudoviricetes sp.]